MKYTVSHKTIYDYQTRVFLSHSHGYFAPREVRGQECIGGELLITPEPAVLTRHRDYFGNQATFFAIQEPHLRLEVVTRFSVLLDPPEHPEPDSTPAWDSSAELPVEEFAFSFPSSLCPRSQALRDYALPSFKPGRPLLAAAVDFNSRIFKEFTFDPAATNVSTPVDEVFENRKGVCQDFAHLMIAALRSLGLSARYVSGYIRTKPPPGKPRLEGADASHAWVSLMVPGWGWVDLDPTNNMLVGTDHVTLAWGRDYNDVCPVRGVVLGGGDQKVTVGVDVLEV
ncbi:MAG: transglutaminase family protein [Candidatus Eremiobacteraeota bacterium]|nr:transglutaminase family protein [Candidatus Eremiobacteraeota bacterium]